MRSGNRAPPPDSTITSPSWIPGAMSTGWKVSHTCRVMPEGTETAYRPSSAATSGRAAATGTPVRVSVQATSWTVTYPGLSPPGSPLSRKATCVGSPPLLLTLKAAARYSPRIR